MTHGTVLSLYLEKHGAGSAFHLWRRLGLPAMVVMEPGGRGVVEIVERVE